MKEISIDLVRSNLKETFNQLVKNTVVNGFTGESANPENFTSKEEQENIFSLWVFFIEGFKLCAGVSIEMEKNGFKLPGLEGLK